MRNDVSSAVPDPNTAIKCADGQLPAIFNYKHDSLESIGKAFPGLIPIRAIFKQWENKWYLNQLEFHMCSYNLNNTANVGIHIYDT